MSRDPRAITVPKLIAKKHEGDKITALTAYDFTFATLLDEAGIDVLLVGDSLAMVVQGHANTLPATVDQMIYHGEMVARAAKRALVVVDLPFASYHVSVEQAVENAARVLKETRCQAVKLEGGASRAATIKALVEADIPVMAHCGLLPQGIHRWGGYSMQRDEARLLDDARAVEEAGAFSVILECVRHDISAKVTAELKIPTIGIGAGPDCDGQILVINDLLGLTVGYLPKFVRKYADLQATVTQAVHQYRDDIHGGRFPGQD